MLRGPGGSTIVTPTPVPVRENRLLPPGGPIEAPQPEARTTPPELVRPAVFPMKARLVTVQAFEALSLTELSIEVNVWLSDAEEKDILDWELGVDPLTGYPRFVILYTE